MLTVYFALQHNGRRIFLLLASYYFYMSWRPEYILLILLSTLVDFVAAQGIAGSGSKAVRKTWLGVSLAVNLGLLAYFKYYFFFTDSIEWVLSEWSIFYHFPDFNIILPVGISFYTFQTLSYTIDIYRGDTKPEKDFLTFALYVSFWPQLVAGPIERSFQLLPQFKKKVEFDYERIRTGLALMTWGFFKKVVIADRLVEYVDMVFAEPERFGGLYNWLATYFFGVQIYCDFSGYSDIAIGAAMVLGFTLMENFRQPYLSLSIREFWSRWHISLSTWFRDYLYIPLGGNRGSLVFWYRNLMIIFLVSGLWHGANWTFVVWGALHGIYMVAEQIFARVKGKGRNKNFSSNKGFSIKNILRWLLTIHLVMLGWIFFRAQNVQDAWTIISRLPDIRSWGMQINIFRNPNDFYIAILLVVGLFTVEFAQNRWDIKQRIWRLPSAAKWAMFLALLFATILFSKFDNANFLYFQF